MPPNAEQLSEEGHDRIVEVVDRYVRPLIDWYQRKKRWPRRLYRATTVAVILLGASIPLLTIAEPSEGSRLLIATVGVTISGLTGLATVTDWQRRWQIFTGAQTSLEVRLAEWELAVAEAGLVEPADQARKLKLEATRDLSTASMTIRLMETQEFYAGQPKVNQGLLGHSGPLQV